jgi:hypothetical protein
MTKPSSATTSRMTKAAQASAARVENLKAQLKYRVRNGLT